MPPHRIVGKHDDVALADRHVDDRRFTRKLSSAGEFTTDQQVLFPPQISARHAAASPAAAVAEREPPLIRIWRPGGSQRRPSLYDIGIISRAAAGCTAGRCRCPPPPPPPPPTAGAAKSGNLDQRRLIEIHRQLFVVTVGDRAFAIRKDRVIYRSASLKRRRRILDRDALGDPVIDRERGVIADRDKQPARFDEFLQIGDTLSPHSAANVVGLIRRECEIRRNVRLFPRDRSFRITAFWVSANDRLGAAADRPPNDHIPFIPQIWRAADRLIRNIIIGYAQFIKLDPVPALILRVDPRMHDCDARGTLTAC